MQNTKVLSFSDETRAKILSGVTQLARAVKVTLGPRGRNVCIERRHGSPSVTKDGVTVARAITLPDRFENIGAELVKEVASRTGESAGDGTTTATVLAEAIFREGLKNVTAGANPMALKRGIDYAVERIVEGLGKLSKKLETSAEIIQVATIAANGDREIGELIAGAMEKVGREGVITVEEARSLQTTVEVVEGLRFEQGYISPYFQTNEKGEAVLEDCAVLCYEKRVSTLAEVMPLLNNIVKNNRALLIISEDTDSEALAMTVVNKMKGKLKVCAVKAPGGGAFRKEMLQDIATVTGGRAFLSETGVKLENVPYAELGSAAKVIVDKKTTTIISGAGTKEKIAERAESVRQALKAADLHPAEKAAMQNRLAKLAGGVAIMKVGGATEAEIWEKKDRIDDSIHATRAALEEGIVPGGGTALIRCGAELGILIKTPIYFFDPSKVDGEKLKPGEVVAASDPESSIIHAAQEPFDKDYIVGVQIVLRAIEEPLRQIAQNAGMIGEVIVSEVRKQKNPNFGYNANQKDFTDDNITEDLMEAGVIDPTKVVRLALQNAASVAGLLITTEAMIAFKEDEKPKPRNPFEQPEEEDVT